LLTLACFGGGVVLVVKVMKRPPAS